MTTAKVQISVGLLEKLAGIQKPTQQKHKQQPHGPPGLPLGFGIPLVPHIPHHHTAEGPIGPDAALQRQIKQSQRVGTLLLKSEEDEVAAINQRADELIQQYSPPARPLSCKAEQQAVLECYNNNSADVLQCSQLVDLYAACAQAAAGQLIS